MVPAGEERWREGRVVVSLEPGLRSSPELTVIPTLTIRGRTVLKVHYYARSAPDLDQVRQWSGTWRAASGAAASRMIWFQDHPAGAHTRMLLKTYTCDDHHGGGEVTELESCKAADTFGDFARQQAADGFAFLRDRVTAGLCDGPILVAVADQQIVGAARPA